MKLGRVFWIVTFFLVGHLKIRAFLRVFHKSIPGTDRWRLSLDFRVTPGPTAEKPSVPNAKQGRWGRRCFFGRSGGQKHGWFLGMLRKGGSPKHNVPSLVGNCFQLVLRVSSWWKSRSITIVVVTIDFWNFYGTILAWNKIWRKNIGKNADVCGCCS